MYRAAMRASGQSRSTSTRPPEGSPHKTPIPCPLFHCLGISSMPQRSFCQPGRLGFFSPGGTGMGASPARIYWAAARLVSALSLAFSLVLRYDSSNGTPFRDLRPSGSLNWSGLSVQPLLHVFQPSDPVAEVCNCICAATSALAFTFQSPDPATEICNLLPQRSIHLAKPQSMG